MLHYILTSPDRVEAIFVSLGGIAKLVYVGCPSPFAPNLGGRWLWGATRWRWGQCVRMSIERKLGDKRARVLFSSVLPVGEFDVALTRLVIIAAMTCEK